MDYTVKDLCEMSGVSARTLRYYHQIGLLKPARIDPNGYRIYGQEQVDILQQILFYKELGIGLAEIKKIVNSEEFDSYKSLEGHLSSLIEKRKQIDLLIQNVSKTIGTLKGEKTMSDKEKFEGFKKQIVAENEENYGKEMREKYGDGAIDTSNKKVSGMTQAQWSKQEELSNKIFAQLKKAMHIGSPSCENAQKACELHKQWICMFWKEGMYSKEAHMGLGEMYVSDPRFKSFYDDAIGKGGAKFLRDALAVFTKE